MEAAASSQQQQLDRIQLQMQQLLAQTSSITAAGSSSDSVSQVEAQRLANRKQLELLADVQARLMEEQVKLERAVKQERVEENPKEDEEQEKPEQKAQPKAKSTALDNQRSRARRLARPGDTGACPGARGWPGKQLRARALQARVVRAR